MTLNNKELLECNSLSYIFRRPLWNTFPRSRRSFLRNDILKDLRCLYLNAAESEWVTLLTSNLFVWLFLQSPSATVSDWIIQLFHDQSSNEAHLKRHCKVEKNSWWKFCWLWSDLKLFPHPIVYKGREKH